MLPACSWFRSPVATLPAGVLLPFKVIINNAGGIASPDKE
jgi:hypothetical protein